MTRKLESGALGFAIGIVLAIGVASAVPSSPSPEPSDTSKNAEQELYDRGVDLAENGDWEEARKIFAQLEVRKPEDPDVLNMLAFTQRKTGDLDTAIENYRKALTIKPKFPQAREYLAEAYLQAALREAETLRSYGHEGAEELGTLAKSFQAAAADAASGFAPAKSKEQAEESKKSSKW